MIDRGKRNKEDWRLLLTAEQPNNEQNQTKSWKSSPAMRDKVQMLQSVYFIAVCQWIQSKTSNDVKLIRDILIKKKKNTRQRVLNNWAIENMPTLCPCACFVYWMTILIILVDLKCYCCFCFNHCINHSYWCLIIWNTYLNNGNNILKCIWIFSFLRRQSAMECEINFRGNSTRCFSRGVTERHRLLLLQ